MRFHCATISRFEDLLGCNFLLCNHLRGASLSFLFARHSCCHKSFQFYPRIFESFFVILVIKINEANSSPSPSIVELWLFVFPFLFFSILSGFTNFGSYFWTYIIWSGCRLNYCQSHTDHIYPFGGFSFNRVNFVNPFHESDKMFVRIDIPIVVDTFFLHDVQISVGRPCYINVFQWNRECFRLRHVELNSRFIVMTDDR